MLKPMLAERPLPRDAAIPPAKGCRPARSVTVNLAESPLGWLRAHGKLTDRQAAAGELLRRDFERAQLGARVTMRWEATPPGDGARGRADPGFASDAQLAAKQRFDAAIAAAGSGLADILWRVVCAGESVPLAEKALAWPARAGRLVLVLALDRVADYYQVP